MSIGSGQSVLVLGSGLSGLASAYYLRSLGYAVTVLDHRSWQDQGFSQPPGAPTYLLGCHLETRHLLRALDIGAPAQTDSEIPLEFQLSDGRVARYHRSGLPKPLHWIVGLLGFSGLSWRDRWSLFSYLERVWEQELTIPTDLDNRVADEWLASLGQSQSGRDNIWQPLAQWLTGNALGRLSAATFVDTLSRFFLAHPSATTVTQLGKDDARPKEQFVDPVFVGRFMNPLRAALLAAGGSLRSSAEGDRLLFEQERVAGIHLSDGGTVRADWYIAALPRHTFLALLPERLLTRFAYFSQIGELVDLPGVTVQLTCRSSAPTPRLFLRSRQPFTQLSLTPLGAHRLDAQLSAIGNPSLHELNETELGVLATAELRTAMPGLPEEAVELITVYRDDHAALALQPGTAVLRPIQQSPIRNLLVTGAWTDTGWPANLESAIVSARRCAESIRRATS